MRRGDRARALVAALAAATAACTINDTEPPVTCETVSCRYADAVSDANQFLQNFDGHRAVDAYATALALADDSAHRDLGLDVCTPLYGEVLGHVQSMVAVFNQLAGSAVNTLLSGTTLAPGGLQPAQQDILYEQDVGHLIENYYEGSFQVPLDRIAVLASRMETDTTLTDCVFEAFADGERNAAWFGRSGVPIRLLSNDPIPELAGKKNVAAAELRLGERWDRVEMRMIHGVVELLRASLYGVMAHDITLTDQQWAQIRVVGQPAVDNLECSVLSSEFWGGPISNDQEREAPADDRNVNGVVDTISECQVLASAGDPSVAVVLRGLGFIVADDRRTLNRSDERWDRYARLIDDRLRDAFGALQPTADDMILRTVRHRADTNQPLRLREYALVFDDANQDGIVNRNDIVGLNVVGLDLKLPAALAEDEAAIQNAAQIVLDTFLQFTIPTDDFVTAIAAAINNLYGQFAAVDSAATDAEPLPLATLQPLLAATAFFGQDAMPNAVALDFTAFFNGSNPPALRELFPYWEAVTSITFAGELVNEFIIEEELPAGVARRFPWQTTATTDAVDGGDVGHFHTQDYRWLDPERDVNRARGRFPGTHIGADCMQPEAQPESLIATLLGISEDDNAGMLYFYFRDPTFGGLVLTKTDAVVPPCTGDSSEFSAPDLRQLHRAAIAYWRWFNDNFEVLNLIAAF